jgi:hypothetical protein
LTREDADTGPLHRQARKAKSWIRFRSCTGFDGNETLTAGTQRMPTSCSIERGSSIFADAKSGIAPNSSLPLPLAAFEEYMLRDDRPKYPMSMIVRLRFAGQLDRRATTEALETVIARHPLLRAKVRKTQSGRLEWTTAADRAAEISWIEDPGDDRLPAMQPIDLFSEPGLKSWASADSQRSSLVLQVHHAVCDGKAVFQVLDDFVRSHAHISAGNQSAMELSPCDPTLLYGRPVSPCSPGRQSRKIAGTEN